MNRWRRLFAFGFVALAMSSAQADKADAVKAAEGLWAYTSLQAGGSGQMMPLTGVILYKDGLFAQQSIFDASRSTRKVRWRMRDRSVPGRKAFT